MGTPWDSATKHGTRLSTAMSRVVDSHSHESVHSHESRDESIRGASIKSPTSSVEGD